MKHYSLAVLGLALFTALFTYSCTDESIVPDSKLTVKEKPITAREGINRHWFDNGNPSGQEGVDWGCFVPPQACFDDVIVVGEKLDVTNDIFSHNNSWTSGEVEQFADDYETELDDILGTSATAGLQAGTYNLRTRNTILNDKRYILVRSGTTIVSAHPIDN